MRSLVGPQQFNSIQYNLSFTTISTSKKMFFFFFERVIKIVTQRKSKPCIWLSRSLIGLLPKMSVSRKQLPQECRIDLNIYIDGNTTSNVQLRQTFEQNYNHFTAKHTHWHLQWYSYGRRHLKRTKALGFEKNRHCVTH